MREQGEEERGIEIEECGSELLLFQRLFRGVIFVLRVEQTN